MSLSHSMRSGESFSSIVSGFSIIDSSSMPDLKQFIDQSVDNAWLLYAANPRCALAFALALVYIIYYLLQVVKVSYFRLQFIYPSRRFVHRFLCKWVKPNCCYMNWWDRGISQIRKCTNFLLFLNLLAASAQSIRPIMSFQRNESKPFVQKINFPFSPIQKPEFHCQDNKFRRFLVANCSALTEKYYPTLWCFDTHAQTATANAIRGTLPDLKYKRWAQSYRLI